MKVKNFISGYNKAEDKEKYVKGHITNKYVPYATKIDECKSIVNVTSYKKIEEGTVYWKNTPGQFFLFMCRLIKNYTDIEIDDNNLTSDFDELNKNDLINVIVAMIPQREYEEFRNILNMVDDDNYENNRSFVSYIDTKIEAIKLLFDGIGSAFENQDVQEQIAKLINR